MRIARRLNLVQESSTLKMNALALELRSQGKDIINLTAGEPDFFVPERVKDAVRQALLENKSKYTLAVGNLDLRQAVANKTNLQQSRIVDRLQPWRAEEIVISNGGKQALFNSILAMIDPGDEVMIPSPYWVSSPEMVKLAEGQPRILKTTPSTHFKLTVDLLSQGFRDYPKARMLILNSPNNPTGSVYSEVELRALGDVIVTQAPGDFLVVSDEIYDRIVFPQGKANSPFCSFLQAVPAWRNQTITINGLSKSAAMTGWRVGWSVASGEITAAISKIQGQSASGINSLAQAAAVTALSLPEDYFASQIASYQERAKLSERILSQVPGLVVNHPEGAFYHFLNMQRFCGVGETATPLCSRILQEAGVALVPGQGFGEENFLRLSFSVPKDSLAEGCERLVHYLKKLDGSLAETPSGTQS